MPEASRLTALLGPTNTGKTHRALLRMLEHESGMIGLPLRLLAREVYDRAVARVGVEHVALVTGEERRVPLRARYWVCTVEAMPLDREVDFVAVDEIQLAENDQRGHVFTDRLLHARGRLETMFLGADTMRGVLQELVPTATLTSHPRLSRLGFAGSSSLRGLPPRTAVVGFSLREVYEVAERLRVARGGAAIVLGALSPRTRNAQVAMFQAGEVDYLVATDAIGMGLNLDVAHVAFASLRKFDGREGRGLTPPEVAQIAGRAGRWIQDGTFGTVEPTVLAPSVAHAVEHHRFEPVTRVVWRNHDLSFANIAELLASLRVRPRRSLLVPAHEAEDTAALAALAQLPLVRALTHEEAHVRLLWEVCTVPDFRRVDADSYHHFLAELYVELRERGALSNDFLAPRVARIDNLEGDVDELIARVAAIRTYTFVAQRNDWLIEPVTWQARTREVEDRLSDALHESLVRRFVDETSPRRRRVSKPTARLLAAQNQANQANRANQADELDARRVDPHHPFAKLAQLRTSAKPARAPAGRRPSEPEIHPLEALADAPKHDLEVDFAGVIRFREQIVARLHPGKTIASPDARLHELGELPTALRARLKSRLSSFAQEYVRDLVAPLSGLSSPDRPPTIRGLAYALTEGLGTIRRETVAHVDGQEGLLNARGVHQGEKFTFVKASLRPAALLKRATLLAIFRGHKPIVFDPTATTLPAPAGLDEALALATGFVLAGPRLVRVDVAEKVLAEARAGATTFSRWLARPERECTLVVEALLGGPLVTEATPSPLVATDAPAAVVDAEAPETKE
jgi:ATP-dependent RNA helicase SUPV3L1/SUV3